MQSLVCDKCLRLVQQVLLANTEKFLEATRDSPCAENSRQDGGADGTHGNGTVEDAGHVSANTSEEERDVEVPVGLVLSVVRVSVGATRNLEWYPCLLRSADILQVSMAAFVYV